MNRLPPLSLTGTAWVMSPGEQVPAPPAQGVRLVPTDDFAPARPELQATPLTLSAALSRPHGQRLPASHEPTVPLGPIRAEYVTPEGSRSPASRLIADHCKAVALDGRSIDARTNDIFGVLMPAVTQARSPNPAWQKATPQELKLFIKETLEHTDAIRRIGALRGQDYSEHDFEGDTSKFNPEIAQFLARAGRDDSVKWAISEHNSAPHHAIWAEPKASPHDLMESATDIVNAWRMPRQVYDKPSWSWEKIGLSIQAGFEDGRLTGAQRDALVAAVPAQRRDEELHGLPGTPVSSSE